MTNDTTTIAGALQECIEHLENNLSSMGVDATYSSADGVIGLIDEITNIAPSVGGLELATSITLEKNQPIVASNSNVVLSATVNGDYDDTSQTNIDLKGYLQGATVTFKEGNTTLGTAITDSNGIATYTINNITTGNHTYSALFDGTGTYYDSATQTITFTVVSDYINDDCSSSSGLSQYGGSIRLTDGQTSTCSLSYDSQNQYYYLTGSGGYISGIILPSLTDIDNVRLRVKFKLGGTSNYSQLIIGVAPTNTNNTSFYGARQMNTTFQYLYDANGNTGGSTSDNKTVSDSLINNWHYLQIEKSGTSLTLKVYNSSLTQLYSISKTIPNLEHCYYFIGMNTERGYKTYISEILAEPI